MTRACLFPAGPQQCAADIKAEPIAANLVQFVLQRGSIILRGFGRNSFL